MAKLLNAFTTGEGGDAGTYRKKEDSAGRTYYVKDGEGRINAKQFAGAKRHLHRFVTESDERDLPREIRQADTVAELEDVTGIPFSQEGFFPIRGDASDLEDKKRAEGNRYLGFVEANRNKYDGPNDPEAAKDYIKFRNEMEGVQDSQERAIIRKRFGLRGS